MLNRFGINTDTQVTDVVNLDFKGTGVHCVVCDTIDYQWRITLLSVRGLK